MAKKSASKNVIASASAAKKAAKKISKAFSKVSKAKSTKKLNQARNVAKHSSENLKAANKEARELASKLKEAKAAGKSKGWITRLTNQSKSAKERAKEARLINSINKSKVDSARQKESIRVDKQLKNRKTYSLRDLPVKHKTSFASIVRDIDENPRALESLKKRNESWAAQIYEPKNRNWNRTYKIYHSLGAMMEDLAKYDIARKYGNSRGPHKDELIDSIKLIKFDGVAGTVKADRTWGNIKKDEIKKRQTKFEEKRKANTEMRKAQRKATRAETKLKKVTAENRELKKAAKKAAKKTK